MVLLQQAASDGTGEHTQRSGDETANHEEMMHAEDQVVTRLEGSCGGGDTIRRRTAKFERICTKTARASQPGAIFHLCNSVLDDSPLFFIE